MIENGDNEILLGSRLVRKRYNNSSAMTLYRWVKDPALGFPQPIVINGRNYWKLSQLVAYEKAAAARPRCKPRAPERPRRSSK